MDSILQHGLNVIEKVASGDKTFELFQSLSLVVDYIWKNGIEDHYFDQLVEIFISGTFSTSQRNQLVEALVPRSVISAENSKKLHFWFFKTFINAPEQCISFIDWMTGVVSYCLIDLRSVELWFSSYIGALSVEKLVHPLCQLLITLSRTSLISKHDVFMVQKYYEVHFRPKAIRDLLFEFNKLSPHLLPNFKTSRFEQRSDRMRKSNLNSVLKKAAIRLGIDFQTLSKKLMGVGSGLPSRVYKTPDDEVTVKTVSDLNGIEMVGKWFGRISKPLNELSMLTSEEGVMITLLEGPTKQFRIALASQLTKDPSDAVISALSGFQDLSTVGFPEVTPFLSDFLNVWDGIYREDVVYSLLPRIHFDSIQELQEKILVPLIRVFITSFTKVKVKILTALKHLIVNLVSTYFEAEPKPYGDIPPPKWLLSEDRDENLVSLICCLIPVIESGLAVEGVHCTSYVSCALEFFCTMSVLQVEFSLRCFIVVPFSVANAAILALNPATLSDICLLLTRYKKIIFPHVKEMGFWDECELEVKTVMSLSSNAYKYLWECESGVPLKDCVTRDAFTPVESVGRNHFALYPLLELAAKELGRDVDDLSKKDILVILDNYVHGFAEFVRYEERWQRNEIEND